MWGGSYFGQMYCGGEILPLSRTYDIYTTQNTAWSDLYVTENTSYTDQYQTEGTVWTDIYTSKPFNS